MNDKEGQRTFSRRDVLKGMAVVGAGAVATAMLSGCKEGPVEINAYKLPVVKSRIKEDFEDIGVARGTVYEMKVVVPEIGDIGFALVKNRDAPGDSLAAFRRNGVGEDKDGIFTPAEKYESLVTVVEDKETGARSVYVSNILADPQSEHYGDGFELILIRDGVVDLSGDWESVPMQVHEALKDNRNIKKMVLANPYRPDETGGNFAAEVPGEDLTKLWSKTGGVVALTFSGLLTGGRVLAQGPELIKIATLMATATPAATETLTMTVTQTPESTETPVPPTATNVPTKEATATTVPTKEATKKPTVTASPTKPEATPVAKEGEVYIGKDFVALSDEKIVELLSKPENKGKIIIPVYVDEGTTVRIDPYRTNGTVFYVYDSASRDVFNPSLSMKSKYIVKAPNMDGFVIDFSDTPVEVLAVIGQDTKDNLSEEFSFGTTLLTGAVDAPTLGITGPYIVAICEINVINGDHTTTVRAEDSLLKITDSQGNSRYVTRQVPK